MSRRSTPVLERLQSRLVADPVTGCVNWTGAVVHGGYGTLGIGRSRPGSTRVRAHRLAYEAAKGPIPEGLVIDHLCRNPRCCNPDHLEAVTMRENTLRGVSIVARCAAATHCPGGHPYSEQNTLRKSGSRYCLICKREYDRNYKTERRRARGVLPRNFSNPKTSQ